MQNMQFTIYRTDRSVTARFNEHHRFIKNNNPTSFYAVYILNNRHDYGNILHTKELLKNMRKDRE
jgi:hypothetical protein